MLTPHEIDDRLEALQDGLYLAEIDVDFEADLVDVTLAGPRGVYVFEWSGIEQAVLAWESADPRLRPSRMQPGRRLDLSTPVEFAAEDEVEGRVRHLDLEALRDILSASRLDALKGDAIELAESDGLFELRIEAFGSGEERIDLHLLIAAGEFGVFDLEGPIALESVELHDHDVEAPPASTGPPIARPFFRIDQGALAPDLTAVLERFFGSWGEGNWDDLAEVHPAALHTDAEQAHQLACHFRELWDFGYARRIDESWREGDLASVTVRGVHVSPPDGETPLLIEECVWCFSLRKRPDGEWIVRNFSQAWPDSGSAPRLPAAQKPWLDEFRAG